MNDQELLQFSKEHPDHVERYDCVPIYVHALDCPNYYCDYACNGRDGETLAERLGKMEGTLAP